MKQNQTSIRNGIEDFLFPMEVCTISQGNSGGYSHQNQFALDLCGSDTGRDLFYAPATCKVMAIDARNHCVTWQTVDKVRCSNGYIGYVTFSTMHDNDFYGINYSTVYKQGTQIQVEGTAGNATGNHIHFEVSLCTYSKQWEQNPKSAYLRLPNGVSADQVCFIDETELRNSGNPLNSGDEMNWKYLKDVPADAPKPTPAPKGDVLNAVPSDFIRESATFKCAVESINVRRAPSTNGELTKYHYEAGMTVVYDGYVIRDGYVWISWISANDGTRRWMAVREVATNKAYGTFY